MTFAGPIFSTWNNTANANLLGPGLPPRLPKLQLYDASPRFQTFCSTLRFLQVSDFSKFTIFDMVGEHQLYVFGIFRAFPNTDQLPTNYRSITDQLLTLPTNSRPITDQLPTNYRPITDQLPTNYRPTTDQLLTLPTNYRPITDQ